MSKINSLINKILNIIIVITAVLVLFFSYIYLIRPIFKPNPKSFLIKTQEIQIKKELFNQVVADLEAKPQKAQDALNKLHVDMFRY